MEINNNSKEIMTYIVQCIIIYFIKKIHAFCSEYSELFLVTSDLNELTMRDLSSGLKSIFIEQSLTNSYTREMHEG